MCFLGVFEGPTVRCLGTGVATIWWMCTPLASATFSKAAVRETRGTTPAEDFHSKVCESVRV